VFAVLPGGPSLPPGACAPALTVPNWETLIKVHQDDPAAILGGSGTAFRPESHRKKPEGALGLSGTGGIRHAKGSHARKRRLSWWLAGGTWECCNPARRNGGRAQRRGCEGAVRTKAWMPRAGCPCYAPSAKRTPLATAGSHKAGAEHSLCAPRQPGAVYAFRIVMASSATQGTATFKLSETETCCSELPCAIA